MITKLNTNAAFLYFCVISVNIGTISIGTCLTWTSPAIPKLNGNRDRDKNPLDAPITSYEASILGSLAAIGTIFSSFLAFISDKIGRKRALLLASTLMFIGYLIIYAANSLWILYLGRLICGFAGGWSIAIIPIFVSELSEKHNRGALGCLFKVHITVGNLLVLVVGAFVELKYLNMICLLPPVAVFLLVCVFVPESPFYLVAKGREEDAITVLKTLRRSDDVAGEIEEISANVRESFLVKFGVSDLFRKKSVLKSLFLSAGLLSFQQLSGITAILYYMQTIFEMTGSSLTPEESSIIIGAVQFLTSLITPIFTDKYGRRLFFFISGIGTSISLTFLAIYLHLKSQGLTASDLNFLPILCFFIFIVSYTVGFGPIPFVILGEIFPPHIKQAAATVSISIGFTCASLIALLFPYMLDRVGIAGTLQIFAGFCVLSILFTHRFLPDTNMKSFSEIQKMSGILPEAVNKQI